MKITPHLAEYGYIQTHDPKQSRVSSPRNLYARFALDPRTKRDAYRLRHLSYVSQDHMDPREDGEFSDEYDEVPSHTTVVVYENRVAVASVRVCYLDRRSEGFGGSGLPLAEVFPDEFASLVEHNARPMEISRLVRHPDHSDNQRLVFVLFRMVAFLIRHHDPDFVASCVRPNHSAFYRRLRFEHIAGPQPYSCLRFMTNLLIFPRRSYDATSNDTKMFRFTPSAFALYEGLLHGDTVPVFGCA